MIDPNQAAVWQQYETQGYLHVRNILSRPLVDRLTDLIYNQFEAQAGYFYAQTGVCLEDAAAARRCLDSRADEAAWFETLPRGLQHLFKGEFPLEVRTREEFLGIAAEEDLTALLSVLLNAAGLRMHYPPMLRFKVPGANQAQVPLHQDAPYFPHLADFANVWIPLSPITEECGGVNVLEGSHRLGPLKHESSTLWGSYVPKEHVVGPFEDRHITMNPGDVLIFGPHLLHYTHSNTSQQVRCSIDSRWFTSTTGSTRQYYDLQARRVVQMF